MPDLAKRAHGQAKVLDTFLFYNELDLLKVRLAYLGEHVDQFIITEANIDFAGKPKPFSLEVTMTSGCAAARLRASAMVWI